MTDTFKGECKIFCAIGQYRIKRKASISRNACDRKVENETDKCGRTGSIVDSRHKRRTGPQPLQIAQ